MTTRVLLFQALLLLIGGLVHALIYLWARDAFPRLQKAKKPLRAVLIFLVLLPPVTRLVTSATHAPMAAMVNAFAVTEAMIVLLAALPIIVLRAIGSRLGPPPAKDPAPSMTRRQAVEGLGGLAVLGAGASVIGWGAVRGRHAFVTEEVVVRIKGLPKVLDGYVIGQVSDIHVGNFVQERELAEGLDRLREVKADLIVVTGDLVDFDPSYIPMMVRAFAALTARDGVKTILGNHDYYTGAQKVTAALEAAGIDSLVNAGRLIRGGDGGGFALLGVDDATGGRAGGPGPNLARALSMVPDDVPRILLSHQPMTVDYWAGKVALQLSGHTHGGQFNPGFRPADLFMRYVAGRYECGGTTLYVNRGFGVVGPPVRLGAPPEVTKIVLVSA